MAFVAEGERKPSSVKARSSRAIFVNHTLGEYRTAEFVQRRQLAHGDVFQNDRQHVVGIWQATGQVDDRLARNY
jgi:hypothetical protein